MALARRFGARVGARGGERQPFIDRVDDLGVVDPAQVRRGDPEVCVPALSRYDEQRDALAGHLHSVSVPEPVRR
ncbi:MAG: hypothetical protein JO321_04815 [Solirubrobacterales bacterium]|nr:hypothetical protein [Solirubrobacterales bacterium]MBV9167876.1 hypothetical protein [Solirubrobacterales bacterium]MBV9534721.1 hypothetical protein [Solirubrobacterales bacterium]